MITREQLKTDIAEFLKVNNRSYAEDDVENYIYQGAYEKLMKDKFGNSPFQRLRSDNQEKVDKVISQEPKQSQNEENEPNTKSFLTKGGVKVNQKSI